MKYKILSGRNPHTGGNMKLARFSDVEVLSTDEAFKLAKENGYIKGQLAECKAAVVGFFDQMRALFLQGKGVKLSDFISLAPYLYGKVNEDLSLDHATSKVRVQARLLKDLKFDLSDFSYENSEDTGSKPRINGFQSEGGLVNGICTPGAAMLVTGQNLTFYPRLGDTASILWKDANGTEHTIEMAPSMSSATCVKFNWDEELDDIPVDTDITIALTLCGGVEDGAKWSVSKQAKLVAAS